MSDKSMARRVELRLKFQNVKVPADINKYLSSLTFTDEEEDNADDLQLAFDDREDKWLGKWLEIKPTVIKTKTTVKKQVEAENVVNYVVKAFFGPICYPNEIPQMPVLQGFPGFGCSCRG